MNWSLPSSTMALSTYSLHLWKVKLPLSEERENFLGTLLTPAERARADRFHFPKDRYRFTQFRGLLRYLLGRYLQEAPESIPLEENPNGKPFLSPSRGGPPLYFNLAHSEEAGLLGFSQVGDLGVDVEKIKEPYDGEKLAGRYFSPQESGYLSSMPEKEKTKTFFRLWTLKEAYLKALGLGFSGGLDTFSVQIDEGEGAARLAGRHPDDHQGPWLLKYFEVEEGFTGALAGTDQVKEIQFFDGNRLEINNARDRT